MPQQFNATMAHAAFPFFFPAGLLFLALWKKNRRIGDRENRRQNALTPRFPNSPVPLPY
jgi:hypothetical protein